MFQGKPTRRDVRVDVEIRSTSTVAISSVELAVFLGASMQDIERTRPEALPTRRARNLEHGGLAFRQELQVIVPPGATRTLEVERRALPLEADLYGVRVVAVTCRTIQEVGDGVVALPRDDPPQWLLLAALVAVLVVAGLLIVRLR